MSYAFTVRGASRLLVMAAASATFAPGVDRDAALCNAGNTVRVLGPPPPGHLIELQMSGALEQAEGRVVACQTSATARFVCSP